MKQHWIYKTLMGCLSLFLASCAEETTDGQTGTPQGTSITVSVAPMQRVGIEQTRALFPLGPEDENMIKTLALLVFDQEGQHYIANEDFYGFRQLTSADSPNGTLTVNEPQYPADLTNGTICAVANMSEQELLTALREKAAESGQSYTISLPQFKELTVELPYIQKADSVGLVSNIYMFGYYEGDLKPYPEASAPNISISLGRIVTRLDVSLSTNKNVEDQHFLFAIRLCNTSRIAYLFPGDHSPGTTHTDDYYYPITLTQTPNSLYYYVGPHSATTEEEATYMEIAYGKQANESGTLDIEHTKTKFVQIALCNDPPGTENRNYWLNRNSIYDISIQLVRKTTRSSNDTTSRNAVTTTAPGVYEVEIDANE